MGNTGFIKTNGTRFVDGNDKEYIIKGMGFWGGNGSSAPDSFHEQDFKNMADIGFNSVRLYLGANFFEDMSTNPISYKQATWDWLNERIKWARKYNMTLVLNFHFTPAAKSISDRALFTDTDRQDRLVRLWRAVAERYKDEPVIAGYDIVNEPNSKVIDTPPYHATFKVWEDLANRVVAAIREVDINHVIIIERLWLSGCVDPKNNASPNDQHDKWQNVNGKFNFPDITDPANNYAYTYHCYEPGRYCHQTAGDCTDGTDRVYPADMIAKHDGNYKMNKEFLEHAYTIPLDYIKSKNVPAYIGELGIHIGNFQENSQGINKGGRQWILDIIDILDKYKLSFNYHPYYEYEIRPEVYPDFASALKEVFRNERVISYIPKTDHHYRTISDYIEEVPDEDYIKAPKSAIEAFNDIKFAVRIHFGIYSMLKLNDESWQFLKMSHEEKAKYNELYKTFNPQKFNAEEWMSLFERSGIKAMAFTTKHHEGFSLFDTKTRVRRRINWTAENGPVVEDCDLAYSITETPFKRDMVGELCEAAKKHNIKMDLYFSHPDWYDADFAPYGYHPMMTENMKELLNDEDNNSDRYDTLIGLKTPANNQESEDRMVKRHCEQLKEILTNYESVDMICLDMWFGPKIWPRIKKTIKEIRKIRPDIMLRSRGIGNYGDYYTPENYMPGVAANTGMPWMVIHALGSSFSYDAEAKNYKGTKWIIDNLASCVAKGGNFMVGIGPDGDGVFHPEAIRQLEETGEWLKINGGAIYDTIMHSEENYMQQNSDSTVYFTSSKNRAYLYAISVSDNLHDVKIKSESFKFKSAEIYTPDGLKQISNGDIIQTDDFIIFPKDICNKLYGTEYKYAFAFRLTI